jgi:two-component system, cell cycle sensor histidine kinase and response regulator CckA
VGAPNDSYPYSYVDESGQLTGFAVDIFNAAARVMNLRVHREIAPGLEVNRRFLAGEFDLNLLFTATPERSAYARFSVPYLVVNGAIFARSGDNRFATIDDLRRTHAIVTTAGGPANDFARAHGLNDDQLRTVSSEEAIRQVASWRADAALISRLTGLAQIRRLHLRHIGPVGPQITQYPAQFCFSVHHGSEQLLTQINEGLAVLHQTGEFDEIYHRWFSRYEPLAFTRAEVISYVAGALALALVVALWGFVRQRQLRQRVARQAAELDESRALLAEAQSFAQLGHWRRLFGNPDVISFSAETFRAFDRDERLGAPESLDELIASLRSPDEGRWRAAIALTLRDRAPFDLDLTIEPTPGRRKIVHVRGRVVCGGGDKIIGLFGTVQDVTARRAAEQALRRSERLLRTFYENLPHAVGVVERSGPDWNVVSLNQGAVRFFELAGPPSLPCSLSQLDLKAEVEAQWREWLMRCVSETAPFKVESQSRDQRRKFVTTLVPLSLDAQPLQCFFLIEDVTEQREKDAEIAQGRRLRALGGLVGGIAHEFNNLLTPILMTADQLQNELAPAPMRAGLALIAGAARRSAELTRRLLAFGRNRTREPEVFELRLVVDNAVALLRQTSDRRIQISSNLPADLPALFLNSDDVHQILFNLLLNARDTLVEKLDRGAGNGWTPRVTIGANRQRPNSIEPFAPRADQTTAWITVAVQDNGMGMAPGVVERVFEPFYTTKEVGRGTGLGLATVWHLVNALGGRIDVESTPGEGSCFRVALPVRPAPSAAPRLGNTKPIAKPDATTGLRVLMVDDEATISAMLSLVLERRGHRPTLVSHGEEAWRRLVSDAASFDALILDLNMPGLSGLELARRARALPFDRPILVMSGHITEADRMEFARIGIKSILMKPFTADEFLQAFAAQVARI